MKQRRQILSLVLIAIGINPLFAESGSSPHLGQAITPEEVARWDISIFPDGEGLPTGEGSVVEGEVIYQQQCLACHGKGGFGSTADQLAGAQVALSSEYPEQTIGTYWPYATTVFDMVRRSMPMTAPGSLTDDQVYAVTAYLLYLNKLIDKDAKMNAVTLPQVEMPNVDGFIDVYETEEKKK